jgi:hypothetical protein|tara:strand:- start:819 stop:1094 length:276 start_codon:yes stop_codon:yes gene_type:complete
MRKAIYQKAENSEMVIPFSAITYAQMRNGELLIESAGRKCFFPLPESLRIWRDIQAYFEVNDASTGDVSGPKRKRTDTPDRRRKTAKDVSA